MQGLVCGNAEQVLGSVQSSNFRETCHILNRLPHKHSPSLGPLQKTAPAGALALIPTTSRDGDKDLRGSGRVTQRRERLHKTHRPLLQAALLDGAGASWGVYERPLRASARRGRWEAHVHLLLLPIGAPRISSWHYQEFLWILIEVMMKGWLWFKSVWSSLVHARSLWPGHFCWSCSLPLLCSCFEVMAKTYFPVTYFWALTSAIFFYQKISSIKSLDPSAYSLCRDKDKETNWDLRLQIWTMTF